MSNADIRGKKEDGQNQILYYIEEIVLRIFSAVS